MLFVSRFGFGGLVWVLIASVPDRCTRLTQKPNREITKTTNSQNTKRTCDQSSKQLFPKKMGNQNQTKVYIKTSKAKQDRNPDIKNRQQRTITELPPWNGQ